MGKPAARVSDLHVCPMITVLVPHVGGPVIGPGVSTVLIGGMPAAVMGDICICVGPPDVIALGSTGVFIGGRPAARMGDITAHGGMIAIGLPTVMIGEIDPAMLIAALLKALAELGEAGFKALAALITGLLSSLPAEVQSIVSRILAILNSALSGDPFIDPAGNHPDAEHQPAHPVEIDPQQVDPPGVNPVPVNPPIVIEKDTITCTLVDQDGNPVAGEKCEITLPDGSIRNGVTDDQGEFTLRGIVPGVCKVSFPDIHSDEWG